MRVMKGAWTPKFENERNIVKRWALIVALLSSLMLAVLSLPVVLLAFVPQTKFSQAAEMYVSWQWWLWLAVMQSGVVQQGRFHSSTRVIRRGS